MNEYEELSAYEVRKDVRLNIGADREVTSYLLGQFLQLLVQAHFALKNSAVSNLSIRDIYDYALRDHPKDNGLEVLVEDAFDRTWDALPSNAAYYPAMNYLFTEDQIVGERLPILRIYKNSPIELVVEGIPIALAAATIFSGGKIKLPGFQCELPPLGVGIRALREALGLLGPRPKLESRQAVRRAVQRS